MREELTRQLHRRQTRLVLLAMVLIPIALAAVYALREQPSVAAGATPDLERLASTSALAFTAFVAYVCGPLLLVAVGAFFAGDSIASESGWGTLRYLLAAPVRRSTLFTRKLVGSVLLTALAAGLLFVVAILAGWLCFGWHALMTPVGGTIAPGDAALRVVAALGFIMLQLLPFVAIALLVSVCVDSPLAAVGTSVGVAVLAQIADAVAALGRARTVLPTHYAYGWTDLFVDPPSYHDVAAGSLQAVIYTVVALGIAAWRFARRDITN
jgi:ABC-2 type transport system permease protein